MDYLTNYYKNRCEQLQEHINKLEFMVEAAIAASAEAAPVPASDVSPASAVVAPPSGPPQQEPGRKPNEPMQGDGLAPGYEKPHKKGPKSKEWQQWISQPGHWHKNNPHRFGTPQFYQWEWEYYEVPPV
jgi:hypothetical protein